MNPPDRSLRARTGFVLLTVFAVWLGCAAAGALLLPLTGAGFGLSRTFGEMAAMGARYLGGLGLYVGLQIAVVRLMKREGRAEVAKRWRGHFIDFHFAVLGLCTLGALLGAILFPLFGRLGGAHRSSPELIIMGVRMGGFYFLVWAPGAALVREFWRAARRAPRAE